MDKFTLDKENKPKLPDGFIGYDFITQPDVVLEVNADEKDNLTFIQTPKTYRILKQGREQT